METCCIVFLFVVVLLFLLNMRYQEQEQALVLALRLRQFPVVWPGSCTCKSTRTAAVPRRSVDKPMAILLPVGHCQADISL